MSTQNVCKCPICFDDISDKNNITTKCGHKFHASCLMTNVSRNGFHCPCCRTVMTTPYENEEECHSDSGSSYSNDSYHSIFSTRDAFDSNNDEANESEIPISTLHTFDYMTIEYMTNQFVESGITIKDLVGGIVFAVISSDVNYQIHTDIRHYYDNIWLNKIDVIIENYKNHQEIIDVSPVVVEEPVVTPVRETIHPSIIIVKNIKMDFTNLDQIRKDLQLKKDFTNLDEIRKDLQLKMDFTNLDQIRKDLQLKKDFTNLDEIRKDLQLNYPSH